MSVNKRALVDVIGILALGYSVCYGLLYFLPAKYALPVIATGFIVYMVYIMYQIRATQLDFESKFPKK